MRAGQPCPETATLLPAGAWALVPQTANIHRCNRYYRATAVAIVKVLLPDAMRTPAPLGNNVCHTWPSSRRGVNSQSRRWHRRDACTFSAYLLLGEGWRSVALQASPHLFMYFASRKPDVARIETPSQKAQAGYFAIANIGPQSICSSGTRYCCSHSMARYSDSRRTPPPSIHYSSSRREAQSAYSLNPIISGRILSTRPASDPTLIRADSSAHTVSPAVCSDPLRAG